MKYRLTVTYAAGHEQVATGLSAQQMLLGAGAFVRDLALLDGGGITKLVVEVEPDEGQDDLDE